MVQHTTIIYQGKNIGVADMLGYDNKLLFVNLCTTLYIILIVLTFPIYPLPSTVEGQYYRDIRLDNTYHPIIIPLPSVTRGIVTQNFLSLQ